MSIGNLVSLLEELQTYLLVVVEIDTDIQLQYSRINIMIKEWEHRRMPLIWRLGQEDITEG